MLLERQDFDAANVAIDAITARLAELGLDVTYDQNFSRLSDFMKSRGAFLNTTFDPEYSNLGVMDFWLKLTDRKTGEGVACSAERIIEVVDFTRMIATGEIWYEGGFARHFDYRSVPILKPSRHVGGVVSHSGSTFTDPKRRGQGLATYLTYLSRALSFANFGADFNTGFVLQRLTENTVARVTYGYPNVELVFNAYFPPLGSKEKLYLCYMHKDEFVTSIQEAPNRERYPISLTRTSDTAAA